MANDVTESDLEAVSGNPVQSGSEFLLNFMPGTGQALAARDLRKDLENENYVMSVVDAIGLLPLLGGVTRPVTAALRKGAQRLRSFNTSDKGAQLFGRYEGDLGGEIANVLDPDVMVDPQAHSDAFRRLYQTQLDDPSIQGVVSRAKKGRFKKDGEAVADALDAIDEMGQAVANDIGIDAPPTGDLDELFGMLEIGGSPRLMRLLDRTQKMAREVTDPAQKADLQLAYDYLTELQKTSIDLFELFGTIE